MKKKGEIVFVGILRIGLEISVRIWLSSWVRTQKLFPAHMIKTKN